MTSIDSSDDKKRQRSPQYPFIGLAKAVDRAREFWSKERRHPTLVPVAAQHFGFSAKSSGGLQTVAALIHFGLMEQGGEKELRTVKLTDAAIRILSDSPDRDVLLRQAAIRPRLHAELLAKYSNDLPSDQTLRTYLTFERGFNEGTVDDFIRQFRDTLSFAKVVESGILTPSSSMPSDMDADPEFTDMHADTKVPAGRRPTLPMHNISAPLPPPAGGVQRSFSTGTDTMDAVITITSHTGTVSRDDIEFLKDYLEFLGKGWSRQPRAASLTVLRPTNPDDTSEGE
ncbi:MAG TPA: hypothetical protein VF618_09330 [Thermoanaerobaculia bacterium]